MADRRDHVVVPVPEGRSAVASLISFVERAAFVHLRLPLICGKSVSSNSSRTAH
jgi:hypothetical protein